MPCKKTITAAQTARKYWQNIGKLYGISRILYSDRGSVFTGAFWRELWSVLGTQLRFSTAYHPQTQGVVEKMNQLVSQTLRYVIHQLGDKADWKTHLATVEFAINSLPNRSTGYSPFYLNYGYHPVVPTELIKGDELMRNENVSNFVQRLSDVWKVARQNLEKSVQLQKKYFDQKRRAVQYKVGDQVLLSTTNLRMRNVPAKLQRRFVGPFAIVDKISHLVYKLKLPDEWKIHDVFHVSLLKPWRASLYSAAQPQELPELQSSDEAQHFETEKILRWRWVRKGRRLTKEYLVLWRGQPVDEMSWIAEADLPDPEILHQTIEEDKPEEAPARR